MKRYLSLAVVVALGAASAFAADIYLQRNDFGYNSFDEDSITSITFNSSSAAGTFGSQVVNLANGTAVTTDLSTINAVVVPQTPAELWTGMTTLTWANNAFLKIDGNEPTFASAKAGSKYYISYTVPDANKVTQLQLLKNDGKWSNLLQCLGATSGNNFADLDGSGTFVMNLTADDAAEIVANGFIIKGDNLIITGVTRDLIPTFTQVYDVSLKPVVAALDSNIVNTSIYPTLAYSNGALLVNLGNDSIPVLVNAETGAPISALTPVRSFPYFGGAVTNDDAGNVLSCNYVAGDGSNFYIYKTTHESLPAQYLSYADALNLPLSPYLNVHGDVTKNATIIATCDGVYSDNFMRWTVTNGVPDAGTCVSLALPDQWLSRAGAKVVAYSQDPNDGVFVSYYQGGSYTLNDTIYYCDGTGAVAAKFAPASDGSAGNFNYTPIDARTFGGKTYLASFATCYFPNWGLGGTLRVFDVTDKAAITGNVDTTSALLYSVDAGVQAVDAGSGAGDVLMVPTDDGSALNIFYVDGAGLELGCVKMELK
jgi:hypothetical protein